MNDILKNLESKENITNNDWRTVEQEIKYLYEMIKGIEVGATSFESITGLPEDNVALKAVLDGKASEVDLQTLQGLVETLQTAVSNVYTKSETDTLLADKADKADLDSLEDRVDTIDDTVSDIQSDLSDKVDKETGKSLMEDTLPGEVADNRTDIEELKLQVQGIQIIQFSVMPEASQEYIGKIVQYVGPTSADFINGYFYQCGYDEELLAYKWMEKKVMNAAEEGGVDAYTKAETNQLLDNKQDKITAGQGIKIVGNVIMEDIINDTLTSPQTTWSSRYLESLFHSLSGLSSIEIVNERPAQPVNNTLYYVKAYEEGENPLYEIWFYSNNTWTNFGTTAIDLTNYYTKTEVDTELGKKLDKRTGAGTEVYSHNGDTQGALSVKTSMSSSPSDSNLITEKGVNTYGKSLVDWQYVGILGASSGSSLTIKDDWKELLVVARISEGTSFYNLVQVMPKFAFTQGSPTANVCMFGFYWNDNYNANARLGLSGSGDSRKIQVGYNASIGWGFNGFYIYKR